MKYMGSKARVAKEILPIILKDRTSELYVEPFAGGMNIIDSVGGGRLANDINPYLIEMWRALVAGWVPEKITKELYQDIRNNQNNYLPHLVGWAGFNCSYSGKWFGGFAGEVATKGGLRDYQGEAIKNVLKQVSRLASVEFSNKPYYDLKLPAGCIIYCDPPYAGTTGYKDKFDNDTFWDWVRWMSAKHTVFVSEYAAPNDFQCVWEKEVKSSLSANGAAGGSKNSVERLFVLKK